MQKAEGRMQKAPISSNGEPIQPDEVRAQLERIFASPGFIGSARIRRFLQFVVDRQLGGEGTALKEYAIGVEVFDRPPNYDPRLDSIVRVEAGRLRSKIDEYYANGGADDDIRISLPRGSYVPVFARKSSSSTSPTPGDAAIPQSSGSQDPRLRTRYRSSVVVSACAVVLLLAMAAGWQLFARPTQEPVISIAVLPFEAFSGSEADLRLADQLTDEVTTAFARLGKLSVVSRTSARQFQGVPKPMHEIADALGAQIVMEAAIEVEAGGLVIQPRLVDATLDRKFWVGTFRGARADLHDLAARIAAGATEAVVQRAPKP
jgi:TolB-like protein